ncbi:histidine kinase [Nocardioides guangzhouensis]|uniref:histidine kinase n=1 Tax=Nocardioides guangzhouensis TaxID=2497878 RepID=A0A4Q4Z8I9_9ACTN|nr:histidine kinase [Nocardioides guangzhouensis]RYP84103.1 histidine kinase [Nocardioides guangzhouensis]
MQQQPPWQTRLTVWSHLWRFALAAVISGFVWASVVVQQWQHHRWMFWLDVGIGLLCFVLAWFRRRWPLPVALVTILLSVYSGLATGPSALASVSLATRRVIWQIVLAGVVGLVCAQAFVVVQPHDSTDPYWLSLTVNAIVSVAILAWGMFVGSRRELLWTLRDRAERAEAEQGLRAGKARSDERARIAREMHDVLAHKISQVSMHAGALAFREDLTADEMRASARVIQAQANEALLELRGVLGVLRDPATGEPADAPQPTYDDLACLLSSAREHGMHVEYSASVPDGAAVPSAAGRTVYRIVQEGLTNAAKHAPGSTVFVRVSGSPEDGIDVLVRNPHGFGRSSTPGAGLGLVGLSERAELRGGRLEHRTDGSMFVLHGWIPWAA